MNTDTLTNCHELLISRINIMNNWELSCNELFPSPRRLFLSVVVCSSVSRIMQKLLDVERLTWNLVEGCAMGQERIYYILVRIWIRERIPDFLFQFLKHCEIRWVFKNISVDLSVNNSWVLMKKTGTIRGLIFNVCNLVHIQIKTVGPWSSALLLRIIHKWVWIEVTGKSWLVIIKFQVKWIVDIFNSDF